MNLLTLVGIFKDEARGIRQTLASAKPHVDSWCLLDTGSTDGTQDLVKKEMGDLPGVLHEEPFVDFATSRNRVLDLAGGGSKYTLMISGDEVLRGGDKLRAYLDGYQGKETALLVEVRTEKDVSLQPRVLKTGSPWRYEGETQERPVNRVERVDPSVQVPGVFIEHRVTDPERRFRRIVEQDIPLLTKIVRDVEHDLPTRQRALFMLAQAHETVARTKDPATPGGEWMHGLFLALSLYARRIEQGGDPEEVEEAHLHFLNVMEALGLYDDQEMVKRLGNFQNSRKPEFHFMIASHVAKLDANVGYERAVASARLAKAALSDLGLRPVNREVLWKSHLVAAHCARAIGKPDDARKSALAGIDEGGAPEAFTEFLKRGPTV